MAEEEDGRLSLHKTNYVSNVPETTAIVQIMMMKPSSRNPGLTMFKAIGTGFFVSERAVLVTAKHVFDDDVDLDDGTTVKAHTLANGGGLVAVVVYDGNAFPCPVYDPVLHPSADVALAGIKVPRKEDLGATKFGISLCDASGDEAKPNTPVFTYGYQRTKLTEQVANDELMVNIALEPRYYDGSIVQYHEHGFTLARWPVYEHTVPTASGVSGGPVFDKATNKAVGVVCTGWSTTDGDVPGGTATDIRLALELSLPAKLSAASGCQTLRELLLKEGHFAG